MPTRSHTTFKKRQKELARMEKQRDKAARRMQRKLEHKQSGESAPVEMDDSLQEVETEPAVESDASANSF